MPPDRRWRSDLICSSKWIKSDRRSEKNPDNWYGQNSDRILLQLPRGHSDRHWFKGWQSTRHPVDSSHGQLVTKRRSTRHKQTSKPFCCSSI